MPKNTFEGYLPKNATLMARKPKPKAKSKSLPTLDSIRADIGNCKRCKLCKGRTNIVFGEGNPHAELLFIGEAPGETEDLQGRPFIGRAGQLLDKMIDAMGSKREHVYIANIAKCRPPDNRAPEPDEVESCIPFLKQQIDAIKPKVIVALGATAAKNLLATDVAIGKLRGTLHEFQGTKVVATFHPAYLLRNPPAKKDCWEDLKFAMKELGWKAQIK